MATVEEVVVRIGANISDFSRNLQKANKELGAIGRSAKEMGESLSTSFGAYSLVVGGALGFAVSKAADFDTAMRKAGAIAGATSEEFEAMRQAALDLGASTSLSATEVSNAMTELAAMGFDANQTIAAMPGIISAAEASGEDLALVSETVASALNSFGLGASEASRVADILAQSANTSAAGVRDMQYSFKYAAPVFASLGLSMEELAAATGLMADAGIKGEQAGTTLRTSLLRLVDPPSDAAKEMERLGFSVTDAQGNMKGISEIAGEMGQRLEGMTQAQKAAAISTIFSTEATSGWLTLINQGPVAIDEMTASLENSEGASAAAAAQMKAGIGGALNELNGAFETLAITIGDTLVPYVQQAAVWLAEMANKLTNMDPKLRQFLVVGTAVSAVIAGIVAIMGIFLTIIGNAITGISTIGKLFGKFTGWVGNLLKGLKPAAGQIGLLTRATGLLGRAFLVARGPIGWAALAIISLIQVVQKLWKEHEGFRNEVTEIWNTITKKVKQAATAIQKAIAPMIEKIQKTFDPFAKAFMGVWSSITSWLDTTGTQIFQGFGDAVVWVMEQIQKASAFFAPMVEKWLSWSFGKLTDGLSIVTDFVVNLVETATAVLEGDWPKAWENAKEAAHNIFVQLPGLFADTLIEIKDKIVEKAKEWGKAIADWFEDVKEDIPKKLGEWKDNIVKWFTDTKTDIQKKLEEWERNIKKWFEDMPQNILKTLEGWEQAILGWVETQNGKNMKKIEEWERSLKKWWDSIPGKITTWFNGWWQSITNWFTTTREKILTKLGEWGRSIQTWFNEMPGKIRGWLENWWGNMSTWFSEIPGRISVKLNEWWQAISTFFRELPNRFEIKTAGKRMVDKVGEGAEEQEKGFIRRLGALMFRVIGAVLLAIVVGAIALGVGLIEGIWKGLDRGATLLHEKILEIGEMVVQTLREIDWVQLGKDMILGIIKGLLSIDIKGSITYLGAMFNNTFRAVQGIKSPSKVWEGFGVNMVQGLVNGVYGMKRDMQQTAREVAAYMTPNLETLDPALAIPNLGEVRGSIEANMRGMEDILANPTPQPAQITLALGANEYETFVDDISNTQERKKYKMQIFRGRQ